MDFYRCASILLLSIILLTTLSCEKKIDCDNELTLQLIEMLQNGTLEDVRISYSWTNGFGPGDLYLTLRSNGISSVRLDSIIGESNEIKAEIDKDRFSSLVKKITERGFLCLESIPREVCIADVGKYSVTTQTGHLSKEIFADGEYYLKYDDIFIDVLEAIHDFEEVFEINLLEWGPYGTATIPCPEKESI